MECLDILATVKYVQSDTWPLSVCNVDQSLCPTTFSAAHLFFTLMRRLHLVEWVDLRCLYEVACPPPTLLKQVVKNSA
jgi:hypothetical protein